MLQDYDDDDEAVTEGPTLVSQEADLLGGASQPSEEVDHGWKKTNHERQKVNVSGFEANESPSFSDEQQDLALCPSGPRG